VAGVASLHNFQARPQSVSRGLLSARRGPGLQPEITLASGSHALSPADYRVLYNINPIAATGINGTGSTIAVVGRTNINASDIANFRSVFGLPVNPPQIILNGVNPGNLGGGEETEAVLDVSWAGATAPNATIKFVASKTTAASDGVILSEIYIVDHNLADIVTESFGDCEHNYPVATAVALNSIREQAAAQGMTTVKASKSRLRLHRRCFRQ
jgi:pseudomonalisin